LQASVRDGELKRCPIWTAFGELYPLSPHKPEVSNKKDNIFTLSNPLVSYHVNSVPFTPIQSDSSAVTHQSASPAWIDRRSHHRIWIRDIHPYVFCQKYKKKHQTRKHGEFEIYFFNTEGMLLNLSL
jgi:hypothetical protein